MEAQVRLIKRELNSLINCFTDLEDKEKKVIVEKKEKFFEELDKLVIKKRVVGKFRPTNILVEEISESLTKYHGAPANREDIRKWVEEEKKNIMEILAKERKQNLRENK